MNRSQASATVLAFDLGASSGRAVVGRLESGADGAPKLTLAETHRFPNDPVQVASRLHWDVLRLLHEVKQGIVKTVHQERFAVESIGIDTWAVDFGLIGHTGELLANPYHYRDRGTDGVMEQVVSRIGRKRLFSATGIQSLPFNTIYQLAAMRQTNPSLLSQAKTLLMIPDLLVYFLTGQQICEFTNATTTQLYDPVRRRWDAELLRMLDVPERLLLKPVQPGTIVGSLSEAVCEELRVSPIPVAAVCEHDTASAVAAVPAQEERFAYLICGTWSLLGTEVREPVMSDEALEWNFTNEGGIDGTYRLLKNIMGLWLVQELKREWDRFGQPRSYAELVEMAEQAAPLRSFVDPDAPEFLHPGGMSGKVADYCRRTGQPVPDGEGEIVRCVLESLAFKYRFVLERTERLAGATFSGLHMVGGGIKNTLLCRFTANAIGRPVWAGPVEASSVGNVIVQLMALGAISGLREARALVARSFERVAYFPEEADRWDEAYARFCRIIVDGTRN